MSDGGQPDCDRYRAREPHPAHIAPIGFAPTADYCPGHSEVVLPTRRAARLLSPSDDLRKEGGAPA